MKPLGFATRIWFWLVCALRILADGAFAARVWAVRNHMPLPPSLPEAERPSEPEPEPPSEPEPASEPEVESTPAPETTSALMLLALLQRQGRLVDFLEQDIAAFDDAEVGAAVRVVHEGCRKALHQYAAIEPVRSEDEDTQVSVNDGIDSGAVKLTGNVTGKPPYRGVLRHRGWRAAGLSLPTPVAGHDPEVIAPAEVEL